MSALQIGEDLRAVMRHVPSPVTIVTFAGPDGARGITIGSFTSVSLVPPLISFNVMRGSSMHNVLLNAKSYAIQILRADQVALSERFAVPEISSEQQFEGVLHRVGIDAVPVIEDVLATILCSSHKVVPAGDHSLFIGEVLEVETVASGKPLIYYQQSYRTISGK